MQGSLESPTMNPTLNPEWQVTQVREQHRVGDSYLILTLNRPTQFSFQAGQYATFLLTDAAGSFRRSYSIASSPHDLDFLQFCIQIEKDGRAADLFKASVAGSPFVISPPGGTFRIIKPDHPVVLIAGGSGISPLKAIIHDLLEREEKGSQVVLIYGCKSADSIPFKKEILNWNQNFPLRFSGKISVETGSDSEVIQGNVLSVLQNLLQTSKAIDQAGPLLAGIDLKVSHFYLCGPPPMIQSLVSFLTQAGVAEDQIFFEKYN